MKEPNALMAKTSDAVRWLEPGRWKGVEFVQLSLINCSVAQEILKGETCPLTSEVRRKLAISWLQPDWCNCEVWTELITAIGLARVREQHGEAALVTNPPLVVPRLLSGQNRNGHVVEHVALE